MHYRISKPSFTCQLWMAERLRFERGLNLEKSFWGNPMTPVEEIAFAPIQSLLGSAIQSTVRKDRIEIFWVLCTEFHIRSVHKLSLQLWKLLDFDGPPLVNPWPNFKGQGTSGLRRSPSFIWYPLVVTETNTLAMATSQSRAVFRVVKIINDQTLGMQNWDRSYGPHNLKVLLKKP